MVRRAVRSEPARGFGQGEAGDALAAGQERQQPGLLLRRAEGAQRIDGADAAMHRGQGGDGRIERAEPGQEAGEAGERRPLAAVARIDEHAPVAGLGQLGEGFLGDLAVAVEKLALFAAAAERPRGSVHGRVARSGRRQRRRREQLQRHLAFPDRLVDRAAAGLILLGEERFDLFVGLVDRPHAAGLFFRFAAQPQGRFGKTLLISCSVVVLVA